MLLVQGVLLCCLLFGCRFPSFVHGFPEYFSSVRIQDNMQLPPNTYVIYVKETEAGRGELRPNKLLVMDRLI